MWVDFTLSGKFWDMYSNWRVGMTKALNKYHQSKDKFFHVPGVPKKATRLFKNNKKKTD